MFYKIVKVIQVLMTWLLESTSCTIILQSYQNSSSHDFNKTILQENRFFHFTKHV